MKPMSRGSFAGAFALIALVMSGYSNSCQPHGDDCDPFYDQDDDGKIPPIVISGESQQQTANDAWTLDDSALDCDALYLQVSYSGGCAEHAFELRAQPSFLESDPVQINVWLSHESNDDMCEAWITEDQVYDLTPLRDLYVSTYGAGDVLIVNLLGTDGQVLERYEYNLTTN